MEGKKSVILICPQVAFEIGLTWKFRRDKNWQSNYYIGRSIDSECLHFFSRKLGQNRRWRCGLRDVWSLANVLTYWESPECSYGGGGASLFKPLVTRLLAQVGGYF